MSTLVIVLRVLPLLAFAGAMWRSVTAHREGAKTRARPNGSGRAALIANFAAFGLYILSLLVSSGASAGSAALLLALSGAFLAVAGVALIVRSRTELGPAWSFIPKADEGTGLVTTGPYRLVRHPIYLGLAMLAAGEALAFGSSSAFTIVLCGIIPTLVWRARSEEKLLSGTFGERYTIYQRRTRMMIPYVL
jgi:protein-S-isoprenylcysteine O-methyltransferase Ste14